MLENRKGILRTEVCPICHEKYIWDSKHGIMSCPNCGIKGAPGAGDIPKEFETKKEDI
jgi:ribosomal protein L37AE/L43A